MQLRTKALVIVITVIALLFLIMYAAAQAIIVGSGGDLQSRVWYFLLLSFAIGLSIAIAAVFLIEKVGISQMYSMREAMSRIREGNDLSVRVPVAGNDETSRFGATINKTLDALEFSRRQLEDSEKRFRSFVESINDIVWEINSDMNITYVSPKVKDVLGYESSDLVGRPISGLMKGGRNERIIPAMSSLFDNTRSFDLVEFQVARADGTVIDLEISGASITDHAGKITGYRGIARDVSERRLAEDALKKAYDDLEQRVQRRTAQLKEANRALTESESKYRELVQNANSIIVRSDMSGRITYFNEFACSFFGYAPGDVMGKSLLDTIVPRTESSGRDLSALMGDIFSNPDSYRKVENENVRRDGERVWVSWTNKELRDRDGSLEGLLSIGNDITDLKRASDELKHMNDSLESNVQRRTAELASAVQALQAEISERKRVEQQMMSSLKEKEVLLKEIHHRVKNNLQIISSLLSLQSENISSDNPVRTFRESQDRIRSMALIHEKLYQSKDFSHIDFREYVRSLTAYLSRSYITRSGIEIVIDIEGVSLGIDTAIPCGLIINELVSNSLKYAFPGGRPGEIRVGLSRSGNRYTLIVSDNGTGLPAGMDFRNTTSLGLQLVNTLVDQLGGTIDLDTSRETRFKITFAEIE